MLQVPVWPWLIFSNAMAIENVLAEQGEEKGFANVAFLYFMMNFIINIPIVIVISSQGKYIFYQYVSLLEIYLLSR